MKTSAFSVLLALVMSNCVCLSAAETNNEWHVGRLLDGGSILFTWKYNGRENILFFPHDASLGIPPKDAPDTKTRQKIYLLSDRTDIEEKTELVHNSDYEAQILSELQSLTDDSRQVLKQIIEIVTTRDKQWQIVERPTYSKSATYGQSAAVQLIAVVDTLAHLGSYKTMEKSLYVDDYISFLKEQYNEESPQYVRVYRDHENSEIRIWYTYGRDTISVGITAPRQNSDHVDTIYNKMVQAMSCRPL
mgnify:CR=1 FL=1